MLQPSDLLHEEGDVTFCAAMVTLNEGTMGYASTVSLTHLYELKKGLHIASFSVMTPKQMKHRNTRQANRPSVLLALTKRKRRGRLSTISAVFSKQTESMTNTSNIGSRHLKIRETRSLIHQYKNGYSENCVTC